MGIKKQPCWRGRRTFGEGEGHAGERRVVCAAAGTVDTNAWFFKDISINNWSSMDAHAEIEFTIRIVKDVC